MDTYRNQLERLLEELLRVAQSTSSTENDIRLRVVNLIEALVKGQSGRLEVGTGSGSIDILFGNVLIETKKSVDRLGVAPVWARREQTARRQYAASQVQDYVNERYRGIKSDASVFDTYTTNGSHWYRWEVTVGGETPVNKWSKSLTQSAFDGARRSGVSRSEVIDALFNDLVQHLQTRPSPPDDLQQLLSDLPEAAYLVAKDFVGTPEFDTKRNVWEDLMRGAFVVTPGDLEENLRLFATHTVLVELAKGVTLKLANGRTTVEHDSSSFSSWIGWSPREGSPTGGSPTLLKARVAQEIERYNWRDARSDILKGIYHGFIPADVRHDFGEYYTPDWLADAITEELLDDNWCREAVRRAHEPDYDMRGCGVFEPSCGSGTFLRAAVSRLKPYAQALTDDSVEQADIICRLIHALDIHPVAVELAKATMLAALPDTPSGGVSSLNVHLADSLRWVEDTHMRLAASDGILINVPGVGSLESIDMIVPTEMVQHSEFVEIVNDIVDFGDQHGMLREVLRKYAFTDPTLAAALELSSNLSRLRSEGRDHVWKWYIANVAYAHRLHARKFDRLMGNPPWITRKDLSSERQTLHRDHSIELGIWAGGANLATQNNLAALFVATVSRDYTDPDSDWRIGFVMPWSVLMAEAWRGFRSGAWSRTNQGATEEWAIDLSQPPWDLKEVELRPFPQSDACVIFGAPQRGPRPPSGLSRSREIWSTNGASLVSSWRDVSVSLNRRLATTTQPRASHYFHSVRNGANMFPKGLVRIDIDSEDSGGRGRLRFSTQPSRKGRWRGVYVPNANVEFECVHEIVFPDNLAPFCVTGNARVVLPPPEAFLSANREATMARLRFFSRHWNTIESIYASKKSDHGPETMFDMVNHMGKLESQLKATPSNRVVYPKSGSYLFGAVVPGGMLVDNACYYINVDNPEEGAFIAAVLGARALQDAYRESRTTDRHYDKHPFRAVPIPRIDPSDELHMELASLGQDAAAVARSVSASGGTTKMRAEVRDALREDGVMAEIDRCVAELLPGYVSSSH